jgi:hypothetical protein
MTAGFSAVIDRRYSLRLGLFSVRPLDVNVRPLDLLVDHASNGFQKLLLRVGEMDCSFVGKNSIELFDEFVGGISNHINLTSDR